MRYQGFARAPSRAPRGCDGEQIASRVARNVTVDAASFKAAMGSFATGVAVVCALDGGEPVGFTCQSVVALSLDPPFVALSPAKSSTSWPRIARAGHFAVSVLGDDQVALARRFARSGGQKFGGVSWRSERTGAPVLEGCLAWVDCRLELVHDAGDHEIVIGTVLALGYEPSNPSPLLFFRSRYRRMDGTIISSEDEPED